MKDDRYSVRDSRSVRSPWVWRGFLMMSLSPWVSSSSWPATEIRAFAMAWGVIALRLVRHLHVAVAPAHSLPRSPVSVSPTHDPASQSPGDRAPIQLRWRAGVVGHPVCRRRPARRTRPWTSGPRVLTRARVMVRPLPVKAVATGRGPPPGRGPAPRPRWTRPRRRCRSPPGLRRDGLAPPTDGERSVRSRSASRAAQAIRPSSAAASSAGHTAPIREVRRRRGHVEAQERHPRRRIGHGGRRPDRDPGQA